MFRGLAFAVVILSISTPALAQTVPLNATEINPAGLSPAGAPCASSSNTFDGGSVSNANTCTVGSLPSNSIIPLGATEVGTAGLSPTVSAPAKSIGGACAGLSPC